ncbi:hypothetical protein HAX54_003124 [Datura stramonium]|uniref:Uncharacterized protein n=1 Tax=Datura stramonium TaxID=4076 RepID=A0ABS8WRU1_DATST|nr:hypothetical protein [Datura stramonium]
MDVEDRGLKQKVQLGYIQCPNSRVVRHSRITLPSCAFMAVSHSHALRSMTVPCMAKHVPCRMTKACPRPSCVTLASGGNPCCAAQRLWHAEKSVMWGCCVPSLAYPVEYCDGGVRNEARAMPRPCYSNTPYPESICDQAVSRR